MFRYAIPRTQNLDDHYVWSWNFYAYSAQFFLLLVTMWVAMVSNDFQSWLEFFQISTFKLYVNAIERAAQDNRKTTF